MKTRIKELIYDTWRVISNGSRNFGENWFVSRGYAGADAFSNYFGNLCQNCSNSNQMRQKLKNNDSNNSLARRRESGVWNQQERFNVRFAWWKEKKYYPVLDQTEAKLWMTTRTSTAGANVVQNFISLCDIILRTLMKSLTQKKSHKFKGKSKSKRSRFSFYSIKQNAKGKG